MEILFIAPTSPPITGQSLAADTLLAHLQTTHNVTHINLSKTDLHSNKASWKRCLKIVKYAWQTWIHSKRADVIYFTISQSVLGSLRDILIFCACLGRVNHIVVHLHGGEGFRKLLASSSWITRLHRYCLKHVAHIIVLGNRHRPLFAFMNRDSCVHTIPNFAQDTLFISHEQIEAKFKHPQPLKLVYLSNLIVEKGYLELLDGYLNLTPDQQIQIELHFAGAFQNSVDQQEFAKRIKSHKNIHYHGIVQGDTKKSLLQQAHLFCLPTYYRYEGQPISIIEAYAAGCAVITTNHGGIFDIFTPKQNGLEVNARDSASISQSLTYALENQHELLSYAHHNAEAAESHYTAHQHCKQIEAVFNTLT